MSDTLFDVEEELSEQVLILTTGTISNWHPVNLTRDLSVHQQPKKWGEVKDKGFPVNTVKRKVGALIPMMPGDGGEMILPEKNGHSSTDPYTLTPTLNAAITDEELHFWLSYFVVEVGTCKMLHKKIRKICFRICNDVLDNVLISRIISVYVLKFYVDTHMNCWIVCKLISLSKSMKTID